MVSALEFGGRTKSVVSALEFGGRTKSVVSALDSKAKLQDEEHIDVWNLRQS